MRTTRNVVTGASAVLLGVLTIAGGVFAQPGGDPPPDNCFCGPVNNCDGVPMSSSAYCSGTQFCSCSTVWNEDHTCRLAIKAVCYTPR